MSEGGPTSKKLVQRKTRKEVIITVLAFQTYTGINVTHYLYKSGRLDCSIRASDLSRSPSPPSFPPHVYCLYPVLSLCDISLQYHIIFQIILYC